MLPVDVDREINSTAGSMCSTVMAQAAVHVEGRAAIGRTSLPREARVALLRASADGSRALRRPAASY